MKYKFINKNQTNKKLIVFFNGWGMNETPIEHLKKDGFDVLFIYDYRNFDFDFSVFDFKSYEKKYLIAWSMGVYVSNKFFDIFKDFDKKVAINGTGSIIDNNFGIPRRIYDITIKLFDETSLLKFINNMFDGQKPDNITITRSFEELKQELISIKNLEIEDKIIFDRAIISNEDKIVPTKNQIAYFTQKNTPYQLVQSGHCPFQRYEGWQELC